MKDILKTTILLLLCSNLSVYAQTINPNVDQDSLFKAVLSELPNDRQSEFRTQYDEGNKESKEFLLYILTLPRSSKQDLITNYEERWAAINQLVEEFDSLVPDTLLVTIEFNPEDRVWSTPKSIDLAIYQKIEDDTYRQYWKEYRLTYDSPELEEMLKILQWNRQTLRRVKNLLDAANCISISNRKQASVGFARSGMGKYSYLLFPKPLSDAQTKKYNDGCQYIFYKDHVVLEYGGGAVGAQCFEN